jgi:hypothetical protein
MRNPLSAHLKERRRHIRLHPKGDAYVRIDGRDYPLHDWSPEGLLIHPYRGGLIANQKAKVEAVIRDIQAPDGMVRLSGVVLVTRIDSTGLAARWLALPPMQREKLLLYYARKPKR